MSLELDSAPSKVMSAARPAVEIFLAAGFNCQVAFTRARVSLPESRRCPVVQGRVCMEKMAMRHARGKEGKCFPRSRSQPDHVELS